MNLSGTKLVVLILLALAAIVSVGVLFYMVVMAPSGGTQTSNPGGALFTQAAQTLAAQYTQGAAASTGTAAVRPPTRTPPPMTDTPQLPTQTPRPTNTPLVVATNTYVFTPTSIIRATRTTTATALPPNITVAPFTPSGGCNSAKFIDDVSIPDGTQVNPGTGFTKIWRVQNTGSCTWTTSYKLAFVDGEQMGAPNQVPLPDQVVPGQIVDLSVNFIAPTEPDQYESFWKLMDPSGTLFGIGANGSGSLWVKVDVKDARSGVVYDFVASACSAEWESSTAFLPCPGDPGDASGFVFTTVNPILENRTENEPALITHPDDNDSGYIMGTYPAFMPKKGDHFLADIGCLAKSDKCNVTFRLSYVSENGKQKDLGEWRETFDGDITRIDIDLTDIAGKKVEFVLFVSANGDPADDNAFWLVPQILRQ
jgi:hypothetical protein